MGPIASLTDLARALRRQAWLILLVLAIGLPAAVWFAKTRPRLYEAVAVMQIEAPQVAEAVAGTVSRPAAGPQLDLIEQTLMSRDVIEDLAARFDLFPAVETQVERVALTRDAIAITRIVDPAQAWRPEVQPLGLSIAVRLDDPDAAAELANALLDRIVSEAASRARERASTTLDFLQAEEARVGEAIAGVEAEIADYRSTHVDSLPEGLTAQRERLTRLQETRLALDREVIAAEGAAARVRVEESERRVAALEESRAPLLAAVAEVEAALLAAPAVERELGAMTRRLEGLEAELAVVTTRRTEAAMGATLEAQAQAGRFVALERAAVPEFPVGADRRKVALAGGVAVGALALALALAREVAQPAIRTAAQLQRQLGLQPLVAIPRLRTRGAVVRRRLGLLALALGIGAGVAAGAATLGREGIGAVADLARGWLTERG